MSVECADFGEGTLLTIEPGMGESPPFSGSYFSMEISLGVFTYTKLAPGTDGGVVLGRAQPHQTFADQQSGVPASIDAVWHFFSNAGNSYTDGNGVEKTSLSDGVTPALSFRSWHIFWNDKEIPLIDGLDRIPNNDDDLVPIVTSTAGLDPSTDNFLVAHADGTYELIHNARFPDEPPSGFEGVHYTVFLTGTIVYDTDGDGIPDHIDLDDDNDCYPDDLEATFGSDPLVVDVLLGDVDCSGTVSILDLVIVRQNFGNTLPGSAP